MTQNVIARNEAVLLTKLKLIYKRILRLQISYNIFITHRLLRSSKRSAISLIFSNPYKVNKKIATTATLCSTEDHLLQLFYLLNKILLAYFYNSNLSHEKNCKHCSFICSNILQCAIKNLFNSEQKSAGLYYSR